MEVGGNKGAPIAWVVSAVDKATYDEVFQTLDTDVDGFVSGTDPAVKNIFIKTGLPQNILAHIWNLCDVRQNGKLNSEQFALALYLINQTKLGVELPPSLLPEMVPPTLRPKPTGNSGSDSILNSPQSQTNGVSKTMTSGSKELDILSEELKELQNERMKLEQESLQQESITKLKQSEIKNLQNEAETLQQMIKQLEAQKMEARKRLDDMSMQNNQLDSLMYQLKLTVEEKTVEVDNLRRQVEEQKEVVELQENELSAKQKELNELKSEENQLQSKLDSYKKEISSMSTNLANSQLQISQHKTKIMHFEEYEKQLNDGINELDTALNNNDVQRISHILITSITPPLSDFINDANNGFTTDPFKDKDATFPSLSHEFTADPFAGEDPFDGEDLFPPPEQAANDMFENDPFGSSFAASDSGPKSTAFDPFGSAFSNKQPDAVSSDPFGGDPFASEKPGSPTPELPPKRSKAPPPRPVPPKHGNKGPPRPAPPQANADPFKQADPWGSGATGASSDPFASSGNSGDNFGSNFADFSAFDKFNIAPVDPYATLASIARNDTTNSRWQSNNDWFAGSSSKQDDLLFGNGFHHQKP